MTQDQVTLTPDSRVTVPSDVLFREVAGEAVILHTGTGKYYGLDEVGTQMWVLIEQHGRLETVHQLLLGIYEVTPEQLWGDLTRLVNEMRQAGLVEVHASQAQQTQ